MTTKGIDNPDDYFESLNDPWHLEELARTSGEAPSGVNGKHVPTNQNGAPPVDPYSAPRPPAPRCLSEILAAGLNRAQRRLDGLEKPIELPWPVLADHYGGGLWPGLHIVNKGTGVGGTQLALQTGIHAAKNDIPTLYVGLELGTLDLALRALGNEAAVPWSHLWTGKAGPALLERVVAAAPRLQKLPFHFEVARPHGFPPSAIAGAVEAMRGLYPEHESARTRPLLLIVDFLQLVGDESAADAQDVRTRVGRASYVLRDIANRLGVAVLCISSIARDRYKLVNELHTLAELRWDLDENQYPVRRRILNTDAIVGAGKESGDLEYSADSVSVIARGSETWDSSGCDVVFATAKGRATGATWSPLRFTGFRYEECTDRGGRMVQTWAEASAKREREREQKKVAKEDAKIAGIRKDAEAIRAYVKANPNCTVRNARIHAVKDSSRRWTPAVALLGDELVQTGKRGQAALLSLSHEAKR